MVKTIINCKSVTVKEDIILLISDMVNASKIVLVKTYYYKMHFFLECIKLIRSLGNNNSKQFIFAIYVLISKHDLKWH